MAKKKSDIGKLTQRLMKEEKIENVIDLQSMLKEMLKEG